ncbi:MAG: hypothetical protein [Grapevine umbra-like virus]|nr:MAG: hypothetical protein [Grapevine umbra-like virus]WBR65229.1 MAG: hypothetical protein [Grapevine umbra-like virus]WBR65233.1 MAG: hypothetical protein [Grapevine umbra-like virus]WPR22346.1 hypothetical protein [Grapevine umbra-like virus]
MDIAGDAGFRDRVFPLHVNLGDGTHSRLATIHPFSGKDWNHMVVPTIKFLKNHLSEPLPDQTV